jgi:hypothetical protein
VKCCKLIKQIRYIYWKLSSELTKPKVWLLMGLWINLSRHYSDS